MLALDAAASQPSEPPHSDEDEQQQEGSPPASLLALPAALLHAVVANLTSATHLAAAAASCATLRDVVMGVSWDQVRRYEAHHWTPALRGSLRWAAERLPQVWWGGEALACGCVVVCPLTTSPLGPLQLRHLDLAGAAACSDADLLPLARLHALTHLSLESLPRVTVRGRQRLPASACSAFPRPTS